MNKILIIICACMLLFSCKSRKVKEIKDPLSGRLIEQYQYIQDENGSFLKDGFYKNWYENEQIKLSGSYKKNKQVGEWKLWKKDGKIQVIDEYKNGLLNGRFQQWSDDGEYVDQNYKNDTLDGVSKRFYKNAKLKIELNFQMGKRDGKFTRYNDKGSKEAVFSYKNDVPFGIFQEWDPKGVLIKSLKFENGICTNLIGKWKREGRNQYIIFKADGTFEYSYPFWENYSVGGDPIQKISGKYEIDLNSLKLNSSFGALTKFSDEEFEDLEEYGQQVKKHTFTKVHE